MAQFDVVDMNGKKVGIGQLSLISLDLITPELKAQLDKVLEDMHNDGTSKKISEKWFGIDVTM